jgi:hypothetical protein
MNPPPPLPPVANPAPIPVRRRFRWRYLFLGAAGLVVTLGVVLVATIVLSFRADADTRVLRRTALQSAPGTWERQFEFGIGRLPVLLAKAGLSFVELEPEARAALGAFQSADVGIYRRTSAGSSGSDPDSGPAGSTAGLLANVGRAMDERGWDPVVQVRDGRDTVAVFVARDGGSSRSLRTCVLVLDGDDLVIVSARANPEPLIQLALQHGANCQFAAR